jgi:peptide chain release factor subunit 1
VADVPSTVSWERLRELAALRADQGCAVSFYLDLAPSVAPTAGDLATHANSLLDEAERSGVREGLSSEMRQGLKADLERIRGYIEDEFDRQGNRGLAIFAAGLDHVWTTIPLSESVADLVRVGSEFHLTPLVPLVGRGDGALVAVVGREQGHLYRLRQGKLHEVADRSEEQPRRHDQGGWSQANFQRHIDNLAAEHIRTVADELNRQVRRLHGPGVVIVCADEMRPELADLLSQETRAALAGWIAAEAHASPAELLDRAAPVLEEWRGQRESAAIDRWRGEAGRNGRAAAGWEHTLEAASDGRVDVLLYQDGADREAWQCPRCGRASLANGSCPLDGTRLERRSDGLDLAVHQTLAHGGTVWAVRQHRDLDPVEGIGAILRY